METDQKPMNLMLHTLYYGIQHQDLVALFPCCLQPRINIDVPLYCRKPDWSSPLDVDRVAYALTQG
jgi:hypothetical protein